MSIDSVPTIDLSPFLANTDTNTNTADPDSLKKQKQKCIEQIADACKNWGFFYLSNHSHSISTDTIQTFRTNMATFFHLPQDTLDAIRRTHDNSRGYYDDELTKGKLDWKRGFDFGAQDGSLDKRGLDGFNQWPESSSSSSSSSEQDQDISNFEKDMRDYFGQMEELSEILLGLICQSLMISESSGGLDDDDEFEENNNNGALKCHFDGNHTSYLRLNYYPKCPDPSSHLSIHHHTDAGALTILYQDDGITSLQVWKENDNENENDKQKNGDGGSNGKCHYIPPRKGTFVINIGDMIQVWSNDRYKAPLHRVQSNALKERYSAPFFYNPSYSSDVYPLSCSGIGIGASASESKYHTVNWGEFRAKRFAGDYADEGEEIQISHFLK